MALKFPPPPFLAGEKFQSLNRWLIEIQSILNSSGNIDPGSVDTLPATTTQVAANTAGVATNAGSIAAETVRALTAEALLAPLASPSLTGAPQAPTPVAGDNTNTIATTAFIQARGGATHNGTGAPGAGLGAVGDWYGDVAGVAGARVWIKTSVGTWTAFPF